MKNGTLCRAMGQHHKILVLDDDPDFLELCKELLGTLACEPEINTATSGTQAIALLEAEPHALLMTDLRMPSMDGFQVLSVARRRFPNLKTMVMTGLSDEEFRARAYAIGIDLFIEKPRTPSEIKLFVDCVESLLEREVHGGFRGVQSKGLADIVQMECMSLSSTTLKVTNGPLVGRIWLMGGDLIDAEVGDTRGEEAFMQIMGWRSGTFENLPPDEKRERVIFTSVQGLLLDSAQTLDELEAGEVPGSGGEKMDAGEAAGAALSRVAKQVGASFVLTVGLNKGIGKRVKHEHFACENPELVARWARDTVNRFAGMGEMLKAGQLNQVVLTGPHGNAGLAPRRDECLCVGMPSRLKAAQVLEATRKAVALWAS
jgi:CheY-like chemotaxis protein